MALLSPQALRRLSEARELIRIIRRRHLHLTPRITQLSRFIAGGNIDLCLDLDPILGEHVDVVEPVRLSVAATARHSDIRRLEFVQITARGTVAPVALMSGIPSPRGGLPHRGLRDAATRQDVCEKGFQDGNDGAENGEGELDGSPEDGHGEIVCHIVIADIVNGSNADH